MLAIIGGRRSSCVYPGAHVLDKTVEPAVLGTVIVVDFGKMVTTLEFLEAVKTRQGWDGCETLVVEHAWLKLNGRMALTKLCRELTYVILNYRQFGYANVILLAREVSQIRKMIRNYADVAFDFSA